MFKSILSFCILLLSTTLQAQRFGGTPPAVQWKQLDTDTARIIYQAGLDSQAQRVAAIVHRLAATQPYSLGDQLKKIDIVLQNQTTVANGYVGLGPFRSEFYLTPDPNGFDQGSIPWTDQLALHEYKHVQQFNNFNNGLSHVASILFGQEGFALATNASVPDWFYEGDAVYNETMLTGQGRGRLPLFLNAYPSLWRAGKSYSWMKLRNGSLKDYVPSHYHLGYLLVNYGRKKYGNDSWQKITHDASAFKGLFYPFQKAVKRHTGSSYPAFYKSAFAYYKNNDAAKPGDPASASFLLPVNKRVVTNYKFPYTIGADSLLFLQSAYNKRPAFVVKDQSGLHRLRVKDIAIDDQFSYRNGKVVYAAYETDPRWAWRDYSVVKVLDVATNKQRTLQHKTKYFTPDISAGGNRIAAVHIPDNGKAALHILDARTGDVLKEIASDQIMLYSDPKFVNDSTLVTCVRLQDGKMALAEVDIDGGSIVRITPPSYHVVGYPFADEKQVYFTASYGGADNVYAYRFADKKIFKVAGEPLGNYFVNAGNGKLTWSTFTAEGYQLQQKDLQSLQWQEITNAISDKSKDTVGVNLTGSDAAWLQELQPRTFASKPYSKATRLINFHSWRPYYEDPLFTYSLYGENVLNTTQTELYYQYNENDKTHAAGASFVYAGLFPYISVGSQYTFDRGGNGRRQWDQLDSRIGVSTPLNWIRGKMINGFNAGTNYFYRSDFNKGFYKDSFASFRFSYLHHFLSWGQQVATAPQHIFPRLGYTVSANLRHAITNYSSWQWLGSGAVYLPGAVNSHSLVLTGAFQETDTVNTLFSNRLPYPRGYTSIYAARMWRLSANYHFPIVYPDWGFANILYLQRIRGNAFYDFGRIYSRDKTVSLDQRSAGGEIYVDTKWWNQYALTFGFRVSYLADRDLGAPGRNVSYEFILPVSILPR